MRVKIYLDTGSVKEIAEAPLPVRGFTTNPTLIRQAGVTDYKQFVRDVQGVTDLPVSFEVVGSWEEWELQAYWLADQGENVWVKIPCMYPSGNITANLVDALVGDGIQVNVTAIMTYDQICEFADVTDTTSILSVFAGRIADTGVSPTPLFDEARGLEAQILWASVREMYNVYQADKHHANIVTVPTTILDKLRFENKDLGEYSLETVQQFQSDAEEAGLTL